MSCAFSADSGGLVRIGAGGDAEDEDEEAEGARDVLQQFAQVNLQWVPRHRNRAADALARAALGLAPKAATPAGRVQRGNRRRR